MKRIAVLMTVHNRRETTLKCLSRLFANQLPDGYQLAVYMTDDASTDGTSEAVSSQYPSVHMIQGDGHLFWNRGMWTAWQEAAASDHDFYLWLNDDTFLYDEAIKCLLAVSETCQHHAIVVGPTEDQARQRLTYGGFVGTMAHHVMPALTGHPVEINFFNGNIVLVPRAVYQVLGNLDAHFRHDKGDFDYGLRAGKAGVRMMLTGQALGQCALHPKTDRWRDPALSLKTRWQALKEPTGMAPSEYFYFDQKHHGVLTALKHYVTIHLQCLFPTLWHQPKS